MTDAEGRLREIRGLVHEAQREAALFRHPVLPIAVEDLQAILNREDDF